MSVNAPPRADPGVPLLKAFLISAAAIVILLTLLGFGVWRYTAGILAREAALATDVLPDLKVAQQLTAATANLQSQALLLRTASSIDDLDERSLATRESVERTRAIIHSRPEPMEDASTGSPSGPSLPDLLSTLDHTTAKLSDIKARQFAISTRLQTARRTLSDDLEALKRTVQDSVVRLTDRLLLEGDRLSGNFPTDAPVDVPATTPAGKLAGSEDTSSTRIERYVESAIALEGHSLRIQDLLTFNQDLVGLQALIERVALLPSHESVTFAEQERDLFLHAMVNRAVHVDEIALRDLLLSSLTRLREALRGEDTLFTGRIAFLELTRSQNELGEQLADQVDDILRLTESIRAGSERTLVDTSATTLDDAFAYRWFISVLLLLTLLVLGVSSYWLLYQRTAMPLVNMGRQLRKVGTPDFVDGRERFFIAEINDLAAAVNDLDRAQKSTQEKDVQLQRRNTELARANEDLAQFAHVASHDLQEPLRKLRQFSEMLREDYGAVLSGDGEFYLDAISRASRRMSDMIRDTLEYARASGARQTIEPVDLGRLVSSLRADLDVLVTESDTVITVDTLPTVRANPTGMSQLFRNLLVNGMKYRRTDVACRLRIRTRDADACGRAALIVEIEDNGIGIPQHRLEKIFMPFERLGAADVDGTGLGLAICRKVCDAHGWEIGVRSEEGVGSCFSLSIPMSQLVRQPSTLETG